MGTEGERSKAQWHKLLIPAPGRQRQIGLCELESSPIYIVSLRTAQRDSVSKEERKKERKKGRKEERENGRKKGRKKGAYHR